MRRLVVGLALVAAACGHEGKNLSGVQHVEPPGHAAPAPSADETPPNPHAPPPAAAADPHAGMTPAAAPAASGAPVAWTVPAGWKETPPANKMRIAQFDVAPGVQCLVYGAMGPDDQNIERWIGQMGDGAAADAKTTKSEKDGVKVTRLEVRGSYTDSMGPGPPKTTAAATMLAAIVQTPTEKLTLKLVGASDAVDAEAAKFDAFVASIRAK